MRLARVSDIYRDDALRFTCIETIRYSGVGPPRRQKFQYFYVFDDSSKRLRDYRTSVAHGAAHASPGNVTPNDYGFQAFVLRAYSAIFLFHRSNQRLHKYQIQGDERALGRPAIRIVFEPIPPYREGRNDLYGTAWIDRETYQVLQVEFVDVMGREERERMALALEENEGEKTWNYRPYYTYSTYRVEFDKEKNQLRFPTYVLIEKKDYLPRRRRSGAWRFEERLIHKVTQSYDDYQFFAVRTTEEIQRVLSGEASTVNDE